MRRGSACLPIVAVAVAACSRGDRRAGTSDTTAVVESVAVSPGGQRLPGDVAGPPPADAREQGESLGGLEGARASGDTVVVGVVRIWGADPFPQLVLTPPPPGGPRVALEGALEEELRALGGLEVRVWGRAIDHQPPPPDRAVLVSSYEIVSVAGRKPHVGVLRAEGVGLTLDATPLVGVSDALRNAVGAKVWVLGTERDGALAVEAFGIIRRP